MPTERLPFHNMSERHPGLSAPLAEANTEAACVCLDRHHRSPTDFDIVKQGEATDAVVVEWARVDDRTRGAWANEIDATEAGACACVLAAVELSDGLVAVRRAETKTGADYYIGPAGTQAEDLEDCLRLEVSGVNRGQLATVTRRLDQKLQQALAGASNLPAIAGVVGFEARVICLSRVEEP